MKNHIKLFKNFKSNEVLLNEEYNTQLITQRGSDFLKIERIIDGNLEHVEFNISDQDNMEYLFFLFTEGRNDAKSLYEDWKRQNRQD
jgi:hypothetical protein